MEGPRNCIISDCTPAGFCINLQQQQPQKKCILDAAFKGKENLPNIKFEYFCQPAYYKLTFRSPVIKRVYSFPIWTLKLSYLCL